MSKLLAIRLQRHLTQEELSRQSGISIRTIQRIEAGAPPKGYTLKALAGSLGVHVEDLLENEKQVVEENAVKWMKIINLSSLLFMILPPLNIVVPLSIMFRKKQVNPITRNIVSIQILWTIAGLLLFLIPMILKDWFGIESRFMLLIPLAWIFLNAFITLRNAVEIDKRQKLHIKLKFNLI